MRIRILQKIKGRVFLGISKRPHTLILHILLRLSDGDLLWDIRFSLLFLCCPITIFLCSLSSLICCKTAFLAWRKYASFRITSLDVLFSLVVCLFVSWLPVYPKASVFYFHVLYFHVFFVQIDPKTFYENRHIYNDWQLDHCSLKK